MTKLASRRPVAALAAASALAGLVGACQSAGTGPGSTGSVQPADYRARHPIVLSDTGRSLDVFVTGTGHLDPRQAADADAFILEFRRYGRGTLVMDVPRGVPPGMAAAAGRTAAALRRMAAEGGVPAGAVVLSSYPATAPGLASPVRLSFQRMTAKVADQCGIWPQDLGVADAAASLRNDPSWNLGCAMQSNVASQVADPVDLVRGRPEGRIDTVRRAQDIGKLRDGKDPSTTWLQDGKTSVKSTVGN
ncbi:CpaD family pilus assembly protein [Methylobacterium sp. sgz302541]|uniref:CpaD family pilus assembly protein n=1 Tax=unclassified Methylobacterium TaxID=2615210 RepID=UPI003D34CC1A